jgi:hypothetical protein
VLLLIAAVLALTSTADARTWRWPVDGEVVQSFELKRDPFAKGQHRGIELAAAEGTTVRSACAGRVRFAGTVPWRGRTVSVNCGPFVATYLHLSSIAARRGQPLASGQPLGTSGPRLHFGVRKAADRFGYIDPLTLLPATGPGPSPPSLPIVRHREARLPPTIHAPSMPARTPQAVWAGLALLGLAVPTLAIVVGARRRRPAARAGAAPVAPREARR